MSATHPALRLGRQDPTAYHSIGGKHEDGTPISIGPWTFECPQVRRVVEAYLEGAVLNACAGRTHLSHPTVHRNDFDDRREADTHFDVCQLDEELTGFWDVVVFDPPFDSDQAEEHYHGHTVGRGPSGGIWQAREALANLTALGGRVLSVGWNSVGIQHMDSFEREHVHVFERIQKPDVFLTVDRKMQRTLGKTAGPSTTDIDRSGGGDRV